MPTPEAIETALVTAILRGEYAPGEALPTVRALAREHGVSPATIQRVVDRLKTRGLVTPRQGSGLRVNDPLASGDLSLVPAWLDAHLDQPARAVAILDEFLELRRAVAVRLLVRERAAVVAALPRLTDAAAELLAVPPGDLEGLVRADLAFARALVGATGRTVALVVLNTLERLLLAVEPVARAMYADPAANAQAMLAVVAALGRDDVEERDLEAILDTFDRSTLRRFAALLGVAQ